VPGEDHLHVVLVHHHCGGENARPDVTGVRELQETLNRAVLTKRAMQQWKHHVDLAQSLGRGSRLEDAQ